MRLSDIKGERVFDVIADVIEPITIIAEDEDAAELFRPKKRPDDVDPWQYFVQRIRKSLPSLCRKHKDEFVAILSSVNGVTKEEYYADLTIPKLIGDITELVTDKEFSSFFG